MRFPRFDQPHLTVPIADALDGAKLAIAEPSALPQFTNLAAGTPHGINS